MAGLGRRLAGAALTGIGTGIVERAKTTRQETLIRLRNQLAGELQDRDLVKTVGDDGLPVWTPKGEAAGKTVPTTAQKDTLRQLGERYNAETKTWEKIWGRYVPGQGMVEVPNAGAAAPAPDGATPDMSTRPPDAGDEDGWFDKLGQWISFGEEDESAAPEDTRPIQTDTAAARRRQQRRDTSGQSSLTETVPERLSAARGKGTTRGPARRRAGEEAEATETAPAEEPQRKPSPHRKPPRHPDAEWNEQYQTWTVVDAQGRLREVL